MIQATCAFCGTGFEARRSSARFCSDRCRQRLRRSPADRPPSVTGRLVEVTTRELEAAGQAETVLGRQALTLAERIGSQLETGSSVASLSREFRLVMGQVNTLRVVRDPLDELRRRRDQRRGDSGQPAVPS